MTRWCGEIVRIGLANSATQLSSKGDSNPVRYKMSGKINEPPSQNEMLD